MFFCSQIVSKYNPIELLIRAPLLNYCTVGVPLEKRKCITEAKYRIFYGIYSLLNFFVINTLIYLINNMYITLKAKPLSTFLILSYERENITKKRVLNLSFL